MLQQREPVGAFFSGILTTPLARVVAGAFATVVVGVVVATETAVFAVAFPRLVFRSRRNW